MSPKKSHIPLTQWENTALVLVLVFIPTTHHFKDPLVSNKLTEIYLLKSSSIL